MKKELMRKEIGAKIKEGRKKLKLSQKEFADKVGISRSFLSDVENGRYMIGTENLIKISMFLGSDIINI